MKKQLIIFLLLLGFSACQNPSAHDVYALVRIKINPIDSKIKSYHVEQFKIVPQIYEETDPDLSKPFKILKGGYQGFVLVVNVEYQDTNGELKTVLKYLEKKNVNFIDDKEFIMDLKL